MATNATIAPQSDNDRYKAVVRISEAIAACREPEELAESLANELDKFLHFDHLHLTVLKENSKEIEYRASAKRDMPFADVPMEELPVWEAISSPDLLPVVHWNAEERPSRFKQWMKEMGIGSGVSLLIGNSTSAIGRLRDRSQHKPFGTVPRCRLILAAG